MACSHAGCRTLLPLGSLTVDVMRIDHQQIENKRCSAVPIAARRKSINSILPEIQLQELWFHFVNLKHLRAERFPP
jgi:hypothetical protein